MIGVSAPSAEMSARDAAIIRVLVQRRRIEAAPLFTTELVDRLDLEYTEVYPRLRRLEDLGHITSGVAFGSPRRWWDLPAWPAA